MTSAPAWPALVFGWAMALGAVWLLAIVNASLARFRAQGLWMQHGAGAPAREVLRCLFKEPRDVHGADSLAWRLAPLLLLTLGGALLAFGPFGGALGLPAGLLVPLAALVLGAALQFVTGWAVNSGYALIGAGRALGPPDPGPRQRSAPGGNHDAIRSRETPALRRPALSPKPNFWFHAAPAWPASRAGWLRRAE